MVPFYSISRVLLSVYAAYTLAFYLRVHGIKVRNIIEAKAGTGDELHEYRGLIHLHSEYSSDAQGSYEELAAAAGRNALDFLVVTDHNNLRAIAEGREGWYGRTLVLTGVESSRPEGYLALLGVTAHHWGRKDPTDGVLTMCVEEGGFALVVHSGNCRRAWKGEVDDRIAGLEILDYADQLYDCSLLAKISAFLFYPTNRCLAFLRVYHRPHETLARWDQEASRRSVVGFYGPNMHQNVKILGRRVKFPDADAVMPLATNHVLSPRPFTGEVDADRELLYTAVRAGRLFFALDFLGDSTGFRFLAFQRGEVAQMGDTLEAGTETVFSVKVPTAANAEDVEIVLFANGVELIRERSHSLYFRASEPGAYRVEVVVTMPTFFGRGRRAPWIYSNPIYVRENARAGTKL